MTSDMTGAAATGAATVRIEALDALRGLAVLGIFVINIIGFSLPEIAFFNPVAAGGDGALNYSLWTATTVLVEGAMRGLFSLMFGASIILFTERLENSGRAKGMTAIYYRRTIWLIIFGLAHAFALLMPGDILLIYGLAGLFLFPFRRLSARILTILAALVLVILTALVLSEELPETELGHEANAIEMRIADGATPSEEEQRILDEWAERIENNWPSQEDLAEQITARTGSIANVYKMNAIIVSGYNSSVEEVFWWMVDAFMMMLLGMALYKLRVITGERSAKFYTTLMLVGYGIGLSFRIWAVWSRWDADFSPILWAWISFDQVGRVATTIGHIGLFFVLWKLAASSLPMRALAAAGRMALSNYIGQTIIANLIFTGVGLGLYGALDRASIYLILIVIWIAQLTFSMWWLARHRFGPLEWGWRSLTYWRLQPWRR